MDRGGDEGPRARPAGGVRPFASVVRDLHVGIDGRAEGRDDRAPRRGGDGCRDQRALVDRSRRSGAGPVVLELRSFSLRYFRAAERGRRAGAAGGGGEPRPGSVGGAAGAPPGHDLEQRAGADGDADGVWPAGRSCPAAGDDERRLGAGGAWRGHCAERAPATTVVALGGATEAAIWSNVHEIDDLDPSWTSIPYGTPLAGQMLHVVNSRGEDCPDWVIGEIEISGAGVARGYWRDPATDGGAVRGRCADGRAALSHGRPRAVPALWRGSRPDTDRVPGPRGLPGQGPGTPHRAG